MPAPALTAQLRRAAAVDLTADGFDLVVVAEQEAEHDTPTAESSPPSRVTDPTGLRFAMQISRFPSSDVDLRAWLAEVARAAEHAGFAAVAVMDHLLQIPQVGRAWEPIPEAFTTLGYLAGVTDRVELGALVSPVTFRSAPLLAKIIASLDAVSGGRAFCGLGAGWYEREHRAYDLPFPPDGARLDRLEATIGTLRAFWGPGTKPYGDSPETTCYPRPTRIPIVVGGGGERRTLDIAARLADGCNVPSAQVERKIQVLRRHCERAGRNPAEVEITVLDLPIVGRDPDEVARLVEAHRGNRPAPAYAQSHSAGTLADQVARYRLLADRGVRTVFIALPDLTGTAEIERFEPIVAALDRG